MDTVISLVALAVVIYTFWLAITLDDDEDRSTVLPLPMVFSALGIRIPVA